MHDTPDTWTVAGQTFTSRLIVGTGKYKDFAQNAAAVEASGAEIVTVAVRRVNVSDPKAPMLTDFIDPKKIVYLCWWIFPDHSSPTRKDRTCTRKIPKVQYM